MKIQTKHSKQRQTQYKQSTTKATQQAQIQKQEPE